MPLRIDVFHHLQFDGGAFSRVESLLSTILERLNAMTNDLTGLDAKLAELDTKTDEVVTTLSGLAQEVIDLKNATNQQDAIDRLTARAQTILDKIAAAEDAADDQLPTTP